MVTLGWELPSYIVTAYDATCQIHSTLTCMVYNLHLLSRLLFCYSVKGEIWLEMMPLVKSILHSHAWYTTCIF